MQQDQCSGESGQRRPETNDPTSRGAARLGAFLAVLAAQGCTVAMGEEDQPIGLSNDELVIQSDRLWQPSDFPLSVCFQSTSGATQPERDAVRNAVETSWVAQSNGVVSFSGWGECDNDETGADVKLFLDSSVARSAAPVGTDNRISGQEAILRTTGTALVYAYRHEFGHVLGIQHEQRHPDKALLDAACTDVEDLGTATVFSDYDHDAMMNYCAGRPDVLTGQEEMFLEMAYRSVSNHPLRHQSGFYIEGAVLIPNAGSFVPDWTWRGARPVAYISNGDLVTWKIVVNGVVSTDRLGIEYPVSTLPSGAQLEGEFQDFRGRIHSISRATLRPDTDFHTAVVASAIL